MLNRTFIIDKMLSCCCDIYFILNRIFYILYENKLHDNIFDKLCYEKLKYKLNYSKI